MVALGTKTKVDYFSVESLIYKEIRPFASRQGSALEVSQDLNFGGNRAGGCLLNTGAELALVASASPAVQPVAMVDR